MVEGARAAVIVGMCGMRACLGRGLCLTAAGAKVAMQGLLEDWAGGAETSMHCRDDVATVQGWED